MKRCPQCNRVETDEALKFCRFDGTTLVTDSSSIDQEAGTVKLGSGPVASATATGSLPQTTDSNFNPPIAATTVLPPQYPASTTAEFRITTKTRLNPKAIAVIVTAVIAAITAVVFISYRLRSSAVAIQSIAVMPFVNESGNADLEYLSDGMTETLIRGELSLLASLRDANDAGKEAVIKKLMERAERGDFWLFLIKIDPDVDPLRGDSRFQELLKKFNPPQ